MKRHLSTILVFAIGATVQAGTAYAVQQYEERTDGTVGSINVIVRHPGEQGSGEHPEIMLELECDGAAGASAHAWFTVNEAWALWENLEAALVAAEVP